MLFNSLDFLVFFTIVVFLFFLIPHRYRWVLLLAASYYFYAAWKVEYLALIIFSTIVDYIAAIRMAASPTRKIRKCWLGVSLASNLGLLFAFKYFNFFNSQFSAAFAGLQLPYDVPYLNVLLPVGISFYTFQTLSYSIEVYQGHRQPERHLGYFAVYVSFFPQLVAGPIERSRRLLPQFFVHMDFDWDRVRRGLVLIAWGFFKKLVIADRMAYFVNLVYNDPDEYKGVAVAVATMCFAYQIYCDFSGYSDIAIGAAQVMGYELMVNFRRPYYAGSIREFWQRWHISLSTWFRDYVYIPLGGNRKGAPRFYFNLMVTFVISGLWHGANWTFLVWGFLHGFYLVFAQVTAGPRHWFAERMHFRHPVLIRIVSTLLVFVLVNFAWIFFRANSLGEAFLLINNLFDTSGDSAPLLATARDKLDFMIGIAAIIVMEILQAWQERNGSVRDGLSNRSIWIRWPAYYALVLSILLLGNFNSVTFIYFQF